MSIRILGANFHRVSANHANPDGTWNSPLTANNIVQKMHDFGANTIKIYCHAQTELSNATRLLALQSARQKALELGMYFIITGHSDIYPSSEGQGYLNKGLAIVDQNGLGSQWINDFIALLGKFNPPIDGIEIMNEPPDVNLGGQSATYTQAQFLQMYRNFIGNAAESYRAVNPNIMLLVDSCPFWDLHPLATEPFTFSNMFNCFHLHYMGEGASLQWEKEYFLNNNVIAGKIALETYIANEAGLGALKVLGLPILFTESGSYIVKSDWVTPFPNNTVWLQDMYDIAKDTYNSGFLQHAFGAYYPDPTRIDRDGMLQSDWSTLTALGEVWRRNMQTSNYRFAHWEDGAMTPIKSVVL